MALTLQKAVFLIDSRGPGALPTLNALCHIRTIRVRGWFIELSGVGRVVDGEDGEERGQST